MGCFVAMCRSKLGGAVGTRACGVIGRARWRLQARVRLPHGRPNVLAETMVTYRERDRKEFEMSRMCVCVTIKIFRCIKIDGSGGEKVFARPNKLPSDTASKVPIELDGCISNGKKQKARPIGDHKKIKFQ